MQVTKPLKRCSLIWSSLKKVYFTCTDLPALLQMDEEFHLRLAALSGNGELIRLLGNLNERIRYVRLINLRQIRDSYQKSQNTPPALSAHREIVSAVKNRDTDTAIKLLRSHIERRSEETIELVRLAFSQLYVPST